MAILSIRESGEVRCQKLDARSQKCRVERRKWKVESGKSQVRTWSFPLFSLSLASHGAFTMRQEAAFGPVPAVTK